MHDLARWNLTHLVWVHLTAAGWSAERLGAPLGQNLELQGRTGSACPLHAVLSKAPVAGCQMQLCARTAPADLVVGEAQ